MKTELIYNIFRTILIIFELASLIRTQNSNNLVESIFKYNSPFLPTDEKEASPGGFGYALHIKDSNIYATYPSRNELYNCSLNSKTCQGPIILTKNGERKTNLGCGGNMCMCSVNLCIACQNDTKKIGVETIKNVDLYYPLGKINTIMFHKFLTKNNVFFKVSSDGMISSTNYKAIIFDYDCTYLSMTVCMDDRLYVVVSCRDSRHEKNYIYKASISLDYMVVIDFDDVSMFDMFGTNLECESVVEKNKEYLIVSIPGYSVISINAGLVKICRMYILNYEETLDCFDINGDNTENEMFGFSVSAIDDINYDQIKDLAVAAPYKNNRKGCIYIFVGLSEIRRTYKTKIEGSVDSFCYGINLKFGKINNNAILVVSYTGGIEVLRMKSYYEVELFIKVPETLNKNDQSFKIEYLICSMNEINAHSLTISSTKSYFTINNSPLPYTLTLTDLPRTFNGLIYGNLTNKLKETCFDEMVSITFSTSYSVTYSANNLQKTASIDKNIIYYTECKEPDSPTFLTLETSSRIYEGLGAYTLKIKLNTNVKICSLEIELRFILNFETVQVSSSEKYIIGKQIVSGSILYFNLVPTDHLIDNLEITLEIIIKTKSINVDINTIRINSKDFGMPNKLQWNIIEKALLTLAGAISNQKLYIPFTQETNLSISYIIQISNEMADILEDVEFYLKISSNIWTGTFLFDKKEINCTDKGNKIIKCVKTLAENMKLSTVLSFEINVKTEGEENFSLELYMEENIIKQMLYQKFVYNRDQCLVTMKNTKVPPKKNNTYLIVIAIVAPIILCAIVAAIIIKKRLMFKTLKLLHNEYV